MGAFADLLAECTTLTEGAHVSFRYSPSLPPTKQWRALSAGEVGTGRTGEESLRTLVEALRVRPA